MVRERSSVQFTLAAPLFLQNFHIARKQALVSCELVGLQAAGLLLVRMHMRPAFVAKHCQEGVLQSLAIEPWLSGEPHTPVLASCIKRCDANNSYGLQTDSALLPSRFQTEANKVINRNNCLARRFCQVPSNATYDPAFSRA